MAASELHISISAEKLFSVGNLVITNSIFTSLVVSALLIAFAFVVNKQLKSTGKPTGLQNLAEMIIEAMYNLVQGVTGDLKKTRLFFPFITTFFLWILLNNWLGLLPGVGTIRVIEQPETQLEASSIIRTAQAAETLLAQEEGSVQLEETLETDEQVVAEEAHGPTYVPLFRAGTADINTTLALALISVIVTQFFGIKYLSLGYFKKFLNFKNPIMFFVGILEAVSEFAKIISFTFRLFGNIFAGEVLLAVMAFLLPVVIPMPFYGLELFVGLIQALVFAMLSLVFFNMATISHDEEH